MIAVLLIAAAFASFTLLYVGRAYWAWVSSVAILLLAWSISKPLTLWFMLFTAVLAALAAVIFGIPALRRQLLTKHLMQSARGSVPCVSDCVRIGMDAGNVWWGG